MSQMFIFDVTKTVSQTDLLGINEFDSQKGTWE